MATSEPQAIIILIDNSETSINGDFYPNRLDAQKIAAERLIQYFFRKSPKSQIGVGTLADGAFGIVASLTTCNNKLDRSITTIKSGGTVQLVHGIRCGFLALHHRDPELVTKRVIAFIGSQHDMIDEETSSQLATYANKEGVSVDIIAFGDDVNNLETLEKFTGKLGIKSHYVRAESNSLILSDLVLSSPIGPGEMNRQLSVNIEDDPDLELTLRLSLEENQNEEDEELQRVILESMKDNEEIDIDDIDDPEMKAAIQESLRDSQEPEQEDQKGSNTDEKKDDKK
ncbi:26S proteasome non-ATPase regulatory subunit 4 [Tritrichomonas foetus]|uniref:26S proteasome non-ATPase regulatory subunit 4 n=1 Tax=Tritrichomonas foetus TaxID=1144522 RepID=A0A1J4JDS3_9EUKA|nr:26S proteasome non-ATPase regulatory subunit 4 [Tritrichomonas foetus]|eukprot:OHS96439.1 26S proteasome non-ATPase regulatory subunit 4 [Tritrichomonas foetus]